MRDVTELTIYQNALKLLKPIYELVNLLPSNEFDLRNQILRAARSIAPLIAEGFAKRRSQNELKRFLEMALGSCDEAITHIREIKIIGFFKIQHYDCDTLIESYKIEAKQINRFVSKIIANQKLSEI